MVVTDDTASTPVTTETAGVFVVVVTALAEVRLCVAGLSSTGAFVVVVVADAA